MKHYSLKYIAYVQELANQYGYNLFNLYNAFVRICIWNLYLSLPKPVGVFI